MFTFLVSITVWSQLFTNIFRWEIHIWDMQDTIHKIVKDTHPGVDPQCVTKRNLSSSFDLTFFKFRRLVRIGPAETSTPFLVLANDVELYGVRYSFFATRALDEPVCVKSLVVFGNINKFKAFADKHFAGPYNCFSFQGSGVSADDYSIQDVVPMTVHAVDPDLKGECTGKDIMIPAQEGTCEKGNPSSASGRNLQMKMYAFLLCLFMYQGSKY